MKISQNAKRAILLGTLCSTAYFAVYIARNVLGAVSSEMRAEGYELELIGGMGSLYFATYAVGQLINGLIGDKIKAKYMLGLGLVLASVTNFICPFLTAHPTGMTVVYGMTGFFLSMIYAPMTKVVAENTEPIHATRCSLGYTFASFFGSPAAGMLALLLSWQRVFTFSSAVLLVMGIITFLCFTIFEKRGVIRYCPRQVQTAKKRSLKNLFRHQFVKFMLIAALTGVVRTSFVSMLTVYFSERLMFSESQAEAVFVGATLVISLTSVISIAIYERIGRDRDATILLMFATSVVFFLLTFLVPYAWANIVFVVIAIMASNGAATMLWSVYCPSLRKTGFVSSATGFLDFLSYMSAAGANKIIPTIVDKTNWEIVIYCCMMVAFVGMIIALPYRSFRKKRV